MKAANLALKFALELAAVVAFGYWGATVGSGAIPVVLAIGAPAAAVVLWGRFAAPKSNRRLRPAARVPFELCVFALATATLLSTVGRAAAAVFALVVAVNAMLLTVLGDWDQ